MKRSEKAAEGVRKVIEAAEALAAEIEAEAHERARQIEDEARERISAEYDQARDAEERLERANSELERIQSVLAELRPAAAVAATEPGPATAHEEPPQEPPGREETEETPAEAAYDGAPEGDDVADDENVDGDPEGEGSIEAEGDVEVAGGEGEVVGDQGGEGARLIALNMALTGTPREETARYLDENFEVDDPEALLDDVYARAEA